MELKVLPEPAPVTNATPGKSILFVWQCRIEWFAACINPLTFKESFSEYLFACSSGDLPIELLEVVKLRIRDRLPTSSTFYRALTCQAYLGSRTVINS